MVWEPELLPTLAETTSDVEDRDNTIIDLVSKTVRSEDLFIDFYVECHFFVMALCSP